MMRSKEEKEKEDHVHSYSQYAAIEQDEGRKREEERLKRKNLIVFDSKGFCVLSRMLQSQSLEMKQRNQSRERTRVRKREREREKVRENMLISPMRGEEKKET